MRDLTVTFPTETERVAAVRGMNYHVDKGEVVALVGESGAGKSASAMAVVGLLPEYAEVSGSVRLHGDELLGLSDQRMSRVRGKAIGTVFQDPMSALTPVYTVGDQIAEAIEVHNRDTTRTAAGPARSSCWSSSESPSPNSVRVRFRTNCPAASASASSSPSPSPTTPTYSSATSRPPRWTSPCRRRSSTF